MLSISSPPAKFSDPLLRLDEAKHFRAVVLSAVRPAQAAARDLAAAQVDALEARRVDEDLEKRTRQRELRDALRVELERDVELPLAFLVALALLAGSLGRVIWAVTGFTLGHSLTLGHSPTLSIRSF